MYASTDIHPASIINRTLPKVDWSNTRSVYQKLSFEFKNLIAPFGIVVDRDTRLRMDHLLIAIDYIDRILDPVEVRQDRERLSTFLLDSLIQDRPSNESKYSDAILFTTINNLRDSVAGLEDRERFLLAVGQIFRLTEEKRHTSNPEELIHLVSQEGKATAELPLSIMDIDSDHCFARFFTDLCTLMGLADLIVDLYSDHKSGLIMVKPSLKLYLKLVKLVTVGGFKLMKQLPSKTRFLSYCLRMTWTLLWSRD